MAYMAHYALRYAAGTDIGRRRKANEDSAYAGPRLLAVADGMGGHPHGDVASRTAIAALAALPFTDPQTTPPAVSPGGVGAVLAGGVARVSVRLDELGRQDPELARMGTTLTAMAWDGRAGCFAVAHIGDTRAYMLRGGDLFQLTRDHTMVQSLVDGGQLTLAEAARHPRGSVLVRALQSGGGGEPDVFRHDAVFGDRYLLCSDGVSGFVPPEEIRDAMAGGARTADAVDRLIDLANRAGGHDNITCVVADVVTGGDADEPVLAGAVVEHGPSAGPGRRPRRS